MKDKTRLVRYSLGRIIISADLNSFLPDPLGLLQRHRNFNASVIWSPGEESGTADTEEDADKIIEYAKEQYANNYVESGIAPLKSIHGLSFYEKYLMMRFDKSTEDSFYKSLSQYLDIATKQLESWAISRRKEKIRGMFW